MPATATTTLPAAARMRARIARRVDGLITAIPPRSRSRSRDAWLQLRAFHRQQQRECTREELDRLMVGLRQMRAERINASRQEA